MALCGCCVPVLFDLALGSAHATKHHAPAARLEEVFCPRPCRNAMANVSVQTRITLVLDEPGGDATFSVVEARCVATPLRNAAPAVAAEKSMRPSWHSNTRRGGGRDKSLDAHWTHHHRSSQTEKVWIYPCADDVPLPRKLLGRRRCTQASCTCGRCFVWFRCAGARCPLPFGDCCFASAHASRPSATS